MYHAYIILSQDFPILYKFNTFEVFKDLLNCFRNLSLLQGGYGF